ncbi:MAG: peptidyl-prolyl cis-trans isomerase [Verrucomicrobiota bacterium]|nr:peptidyl-prolyl cis-trans isomerase [Verrucomicrobiota bacterium]
MRLARLLLLFAIAAAAGLVAGELLARWPACRGAIGHAFGRGELVAVVGGVGLYQRAGGEETDATSLVVEENLRLRAWAEVVPKEQIDREMQLLHDQLADEKMFAARRKAAGYGEASLGAAVVENLRGRQWLETQIAPELAVSEEECRSFYEEHAAEFTEPQRYRARHLFLAAPDGAPPEVIAAKQKEIAMLRARIGKGEQLPQFIADASEDEATKQNGGDLGFFAEERMPPEFVEAVAKLRVGQISAPIRSHLGFHIVQLMEVKPARALSFEEVQPEIAADLRNDKRVAAVADLAETLTAAEFIRPER